MVNIRFSAALKIKACTCSSCIPYSDGITHTCSIYKTGTCGYRARQLPSVAHLVKVPLQRNRRAVGSILARGPTVAFFGAVHG